MTPGTLPIVYVPPLQVT